MSVPPNMTFATSVDLYTVELQWLEQFLGHGNYSYTLRVNHSARSRGGGGWGGGGGGGIWNGNNLGMSFNSGLLGVLIAWISRV